MPNLCYALLQQIDADSSQECYKMYITRPSSKLAYRVKVSMWSGLISKHPVGFSKLTVEGLSRFRVIKVIRIQLWELQGLGFGGYLEN